VWEVLLGIVVAKETKPPTKAMERWRRVLTLVTVLLAKVVLVRCCLASPMIRQALANRSQAR